MIIRAATYKILSERLYLDSQIRCVDVAKAIGTNRTYLWEALRLRGMGFQEFMGKFRIRYFIEKAYEFRDLPSDSIAERCGFGDRSTLNRYLKRMFGITLMEYMKMVSQGL